MTLKQWAENGWLRPHATSPDEIRNLLSVVERDIRDAEQPISSDWSFGIAYNAALKLCTILLYAEGYRPVREMAHYRTTAALTLILGEAKKQDTEYLDKCRAKRNIAEYEYAGGISETEARELVTFARHFRDEVKSWIQDNHPELL